MALHKRQNFVLQLPMDHTVLLNFAELFHCMHIVLVYGFNYKYNK